MKDTKHWWQREVDSWDENPAHYDRAVEILRRLRKLHTSLSREAMAKLRKCAKARAEEPGEEERYLRDMLTLHQIESVIWAEAPKNCQWVRQEHVWKRWPMPPPK